MFWSVKNSSVSMDVRDSHPHDEEQFAFSLILLRIYVLRCSNPLPSRAEETNQLLQCVSATISNRNVIFRVATFSVGKAKNISSKPRIRISYLIINSSKVDPQNCSCRKLEFSRFTNLVVQIWNRKVIQKCHWHQSTEISRTGAALCVILRFKI